MGRPAIGKFTAIRLPEKMLKNIDSLVPPGHRSAFIRMAVEKELLRHGITSDEQTADVTDTQ